MLREAEMVVDGIPELQAGVVHVGTPLAAGKREVKRAKRLTRSLAHAAIG